jgi:tungstate transport system ATP-binding protein
MLVSAVPLPLTFADVAVQAGATRVLDRISLSIAAGAPTVIIGPNGSGKTTLLRAAMGLLSPARGRITWAGQPAAPVEAMAIVFQRPVMLRRSCAANIRYALAAADTHEQGREARTDELLNLVGLERLAGRPARRLSGGEQQRLALARALARGPRVLFLDEPTSSLDPAATQEIEDLVRTISVQGVKVVMTTHDLGEARRLAGDIVLLNKGVVVEQTPSDAFFAGPRSVEGQRFIAGELLV